MDIQYLSIVLLALHNIQDRPRLRTEAAADAYYERHASADRFYPKVAPLVVAIGFGLVTIGVWLQDQDGPQQDIPHNEKRRPEGRRFGNLAKRRFSKNVCAWQAWQRPTLPRLKTKYHWR